MVLLRSIPELSTIYSNAIDFLGNAMNCKGSSSLLDTINCIDSSAWCDSRDEQEEVVVESSSSSLSLSNKFANSNNSSNTDRGFEEDLSSRSLSSSVHQLLYDSSERQSQRTKTDSMAMPMLVRQSEDDTIFRSRVEEPTQEASSSSSSSQCLQFYKLNRCTAWSQDEAGCYSFESERYQHHHSITAAEEPKKRSNVRIVHWDEIVHDSLNTNTNTSNTNNNEDNTDIFRADSHCFNSLCKLDRCAAWSIDESSSMVGNRLRSNSIQEVSSQSQ
ncbi:hypothetical protein FRACYDRAFT_239018 [Fragilariopsis cylindrus CCMP1102]|uniref:Uncharacterized protein n=1 Tax=Fragilariopsis cylindrus CCMP1102 TaxID=635003 RepID=A0A1E7FE62_9STRA|nr:hypothetical protein FRACYDRAFT_239018 [Fragilariopsis cylindrus CCMP1102]|eukprot:OEU16424.1 hypothetical protein FRACYDRAFT_239018 [Fragilariopsis cylindrus CCMP1102]